MKKLLMFTIFMMAFGLCNTWAQSNPNNAYGDNQFEVEPGVFAIYNGDLNADGSIDGSDYSIMENDLTSFLFGYYISDLNGDGAVDGSDYSFIENQLTYFVFAQHP